MERLAWSLPGQLACTAGMLGVSPPDWPSPELSVSAVFASVLAVAPAVRFFTAASSKTASSILRNMLHGLGVSNVLGPGAGLAVSYTHLTLPTSLRV